MRRRVNPGAMQSLHEYAAEKQGHIRGRINWPFKGREQGFEEGRRISIHQLTAMSKTEF